MSAMSCRTTLPSKLGEPEKSKPNVLLLNPPFRKLGFGEEWRFGSRSPTPPLGLMYMATPLLEVGYHVDFLDMNIQRLERHAFEQMAAGQQFVLMTCYTKNLANVRELIPIIRSVNPRACILVGGPHATLSGEHIKGSDVTVRGEAEHAIDEILQRISSESSLAGIDGLSYQVDGDTVCNPGVLAADDLDKSESAFLKLGKGLDYGYFYGFRFPGVSAIMTSRGCPFACTYCTHKGRIKYRERSVDSVMRELRAIEAGGYKRVVFYDDNFLMNRERAEAIMRRVIDEGIRLKFVVQGRVDSVDEDFYRLLRRAGVQCILFGIENPNQDVLDFYRKGITVRAIKEAIRTAHETGIYTIGYLMLGSPVETAEHFERTKKFVAEMPLDHIVVSVLRYDPGSRLHAEAVEAGQMGRFETVHANAELSRFSRPEWDAMRKELIRSFWTPRRIARLCWRISRNGDLWDLSRLAWQNRNRSRAAQRLRGGQ